MGVLPTRSGRGIANIGQGIHRSKQSPTGGHSRGPLHTSLCLPIGTMIVSNSVYSPEAQIYNQSNGQANDGQHTPDLTDDIQSRLHPWGNLRLRCLTFDILRTNTRGTFTETILRTVRSHGVCTVRYALYGKLKPWANFIELLNPWSRGLFFLTHSLMGGTAVGTSLYMLYLLAVGLNYLNYTAVHCTLFTWSAQPWLVA